MKGKVMTDQERTLGTKLTTAVLAVEECVAAALEVDDMSRVGTAYGHSRLSQLTDILAELVAMEDWIYTENAKLKEEDDD